MKRVALAAITAGIAALAFFAAGVTPAKAGTPTQLTLANDPLWLGTDEDAVAALMRDLNGGPLIDIPPGTTAWENPATGAAVTSAEVESGMVGLEATAGLVPSMMQFGTIGLLGAGSIMAAYQVGNVFRKWIAGGTNDPGGGTATLSWRSFCPAGQNGQGGNCSNNGPDSLAGFPPTGGSAGAVMVKGWYLSSNQAPGQGAYCATGYSAGCVVDPATSSRIEAISDYLTSHGLATALQSITPWNGSTGDVCHTTDARGCRIIVLTDGQFARLNAGKTADQSAYDSAPNHKAYPAYDNSGVPSDSIVNNVRQECQNDTNDANIQGACMAIRYYIAPTYDPSTGTQPSTTGGSSDFPITLPQPLPGETVTSYAERLRSRKWLGTISIADDPMSYPSGSPALNQSPDTITAVQVDTTNVPMFDPLSGSAEPWPVNPPEIPAADTGITITRVPDTYVPPSGSGGGINFPSISFGCQFPFGFICWAQDVTGWFDVTPQAPDFDFTIPDQTVGGHTYHVGSHYDVNLNVMDSYMIMFRGILSVVMWVGAIYVLATKLLGFHPGGDPGEAIDDGISTEGM